MIGKGTFMELSKSGIDFSSLLKHNEEDESPATPSQLHSIQRSMSNDQQTKSHDSQGQLNSTHSKSHEHLNGHKTELRHRARVDSCSRHSMHESMAGSMMSLASIGTEFEVMVLSKLLDIPLPCI